MSGLTDIHAHFVYGIDDGPQMRRGMEAMIDAAHAEGIVSLYATPHMIPGIQGFETDVYMKHLDEARSYCQNQGYEMALHTGAELLYTPAMRHYIVDHPLPTLGESDHILMEFMPEIPIKELEDALQLAERYNYVPILAHIERYACLMHRGALEKLKARYDMRCQVNANTVLKDQGFFRTRRIRGWFRDGLVDHVASDAHNTTTRPFQMKKACAMIAQNYGPDAAARLMGTT